jgi:hypothetical protein
MKKLKPPKNYRRLRRRCCANCKYWQQDEGHLCLRAPESIAGDWLSMEPEFRVCDRYIREGS